MLANLKEKAKENAANIVEAAKDQGSAQASSFLDGLKKEVI